MRLIGLLGSWALFVLGFGLAAIAAAGAWVNIQDSRKLERYAAIETLLAERVAGRTAELRRAREKSGSSRSLVRSKMAAASRPRGNPGAVAFPAKGPPPDGFFVELARKNGMNVVRLGPGRAIDADTGRAAMRTGGGVWDWIGVTAGSRRVLKAVNGTVVMISRKGPDRELPPGALIRAGDTLVIPPLGTPQRLFAKAPRDIPALQPEIVEPEIIKLAVIKSEAPVKPLISRGARLREKGASIFGGASGRE